MKDIVLALAICAALVVGGCRKKLALTDFALSPTLSVEDAKDAYGTPEREASAHNWLIYRLADQSELRLYFMGGIRGGTRTLTSAIWHSPDGSVLKQIYPAIEATTVPSSPPDSAPAAATVPSTAPATAP